MRQTVGVALVFWALTALVASQPLPGFDFTYFLALQNQLAEFDPTSPHEAQDRTLEPAPVPTPPRRGDVPEWKAEFDRICAQVPVASSLTADELKQLIVDCELLTEIVAGSSHPQAKVFLKRIEMCRDFFAYSLELLGE